MRIRWSHVKMSSMGIYSKDLRVRAVEAVERGIPRRDVVETFSVSLTTLKRWLRKRREGEDLSPGTLDLFGLSLAAYEAAPRRGQVVSRGAGKLGCPTDAQ